MKQNLLSTLTHSMIIHLTSEFGAQHESSMPHTVSLQHVYNHMTVYILNYHTFTHKINPW